MQRQGTWQAHCQPCTISVLHMVSVVPPDMMIPKCRYQAPLGVEGGVGGERRREEKRGREGKKGSWRKGGKNKVYIKRRK